MEAFIKKNGVTTCPPSFSPEMRELHVRRQQEYNALTPKERALVHKGIWAKKLIVHRARTPEQKAETSNKMRAAWLRRKAKKP